MTKSVCKTACANNVNISGRGKPSRSVDVLPPCLKAYGAAPLDMSKSKKNKRFIYDKLP